MAASFFSVTLFIVGLVCLVKGNVEQVYQWSRIEYKWRNTEHKQTAEREGVYVANNTIVTGIKVFKDKVYITTPRFNEGVPATLGWLPRTTAGSRINVSPKPYPSWEMQEIGNCTAIQFGQSMEIDPFGRMWIIDVGSVYIFSKRVNQCPPKLLVYDLNTDKEIFRYIFPDSVVSHTKNFLNDIVLDVSNPDNIFAYITDALHPAIIVYSHKQQKAWRTEHSSMIIDPDAVNIEMPNQNFTVVIHVDGIALAPLKYKAKEVYYSPISGYILYSLPTHVLRNETLATHHVGPYVKQVGIKQSQSDGYAMDNAGYLYYSLLGKHAVYRWNSGLDFKTHREKLAQDNVTLQWVDSFAIDEAGFLWFTSNKIHNYMRGNLDINDINYRVMRKFIGSKSYMYPEGQTIDKPQSDHMKNKGTSIDRSWIIPCMYAILHMCQT